jgi:hypothetical protein
MHTQAHTEDKENEIILSSAFILHLQWHSPLKQTKNEATAQKFFNFYAIHTSLEN